MELITIMEANKGDELDNSPRKDASKSNPEQVRAYNKSGLVVQRISNIGIIQ